MILKKHHCEHQKLVMWSDSLRNDVINFTSLAGDVMGPTVSNLGDLLRMPYGCGEQNMLNFAPNIYLTDYLKQTEQLTTSFKNKAKRFMDVGRSHVFFLVNKLSWYSI